jgi:surface antigen
MSRLRLLLAAATVATALVPARAPAVFADTPGAAPSLAQLNDQLTANQAQLNDLNDQVERSQADLDQLNRTLLSDQERETQLDTQLVGMGRVEYEQPMLSLSTILEARSLQQLFSNLAQARLVANRQRGLLNQTHQLKRQDQQTRDQVSGRLAQVQVARDQAAQVAARTLSLRNATQDAGLAARANAVNAQAAATQIVRFTGSGPYPNHFTFGYCTYYVATKRYVPWFGDAINWWANARASGYPEGQTPQVGAILVTAESGFGHVAYVESVNGRQFTISEMNYTAWDVVDRRTITLGGPVPIVGFIYGA